MQHGNRTDHIHATALIDGQNGLQTVSFNESLNYYRVGAGRCAIIHATPPGVSVAHHRGHSGNYRH